MLKDNLTVNMAWIKQADAGYVAYYTLDSLRKLCHENNFDTSECKEKADFVNILQGVPEFKDTFRPPSLSSQKPPTQTIPKKKKLTHH